MTPEEVEEHNRVFAEASQLVKGEIVIHGHQLPSDPTSVLESKLKRALQLFERVLELNPGNWSAMWLVGKVHQRCGDQVVAFTWFARAHKLNPSHVDVARESSVCAMSLGRSEEAIFYACTALQFHPSNSGLQANLALAFLLAGRLRDAEIVINNVTAGGAVDPISQTVRQIIDHFIAIGQRPPTTTAALEKYWSNRLS